LDPDERETLAAVAYLRGCTPTDVAREVVAEFISDQKCRERVRQAILLRREEQSGG
jgi:hypothetical protein